MGLLAEAATHLRTFLEDSDGGFGLAMTVTDPDGVSGSITGYSGNIGQKIDPDTGMTIAGQQIHATLPIAALQETFSAQPRGVHDETLKPWLVLLQLPGMAAAQTFKVTEAAPDEQGAVVCFLEFYET